ncbi:MAG: septal ring lytic transglycosylase RlpA family protein [Ignavibacteriae bacterium]|nr:septal ring lytic transglycosylase RlpA family protein [Ignavibacteriota bacterium]
MNTCSYQAKLILWSAITVMFVTFLQGCGSASPRFTSSAPRPGSLSDSHDLRGIASYYADEFHSRKTANGETYNMHEMTAAHRTLPFNTKVRVKSLENDRTVVVRINDRGPFKGGRVIDLSLAAAKQLGLIAKGTGRVEIEVIELGSK